MAQTAHHLVADGSSPQDVRPVVTIDFSNPGHRFRYRCTRGHTNWIPTQSGHAWCESCLQQNQHGYDVDPERYQLVDVKTGETIPWSRVEVVNEDER